MKTAAERSDTRTRLLDAAEQHFAQRGFAGASLRDITAAARANLAAAHYHFGSKEDLFVAVVQRRLEPLNAERLRLLDEADARSRGAGASLEQVVEAFVGPPLRRAAQDPGGACMLRLLGRMQGESGELWQRIAEGPLRPLRDRMLAALGRSLPGAPEAELMWCLHFAIGALAGVAADHQRLRALSGGRCDPRDVEGAIARLVPFLVAGLRSAERPKGRRRRP